MLWRLIMNELNKNGRSMFNKSQYLLNDQPGKLLALNSLKLIFKEPRFSYEIIEDFQFGDIKIIDTFTMKIKLIEVECREPWQHKNNMIGKFSDVNITLKNNVQKLQQNNIEGFCISLSKADFGKPYASEFYITKLSDMTEDCKGISPNYRSSNEMFYKLLNHQVVKWVYNAELKRYQKLNNYLPRETKNDYYN